MSLLSDARWKNATLALAAVAGLLSLLAALSPSSASAEYVQFCWGTTVQGQDKYGGNPVGSYCDSWYGNGNPEGKAGYIDEVGGSGEQHSVCAFAWYNEGAIRCSAGPNQGVYNFTPEGKIQSIGQINNNAQGSNKIFGFMVTCKGGC